MTFRPRKCHADRSVTRDPIERRLQKDNHSIHIFSQNSFAYLISKPAAVNTANIIIDFRTIHAHLSSLMINDKGSIFVSIVTHEFAEVLGVTPRNAGMKLAQTIGALERTNATIDMSLKASSREFCNQWYQSSPPTISE